MRVEGHVVMTRRTKTCTGENSTPSWWLLVGNGCKDYYNRLYEDCYKNSLTHSLLATSKTPVRSGEEESRHNLGHSHFVFVPSNVKGCMYGCSNRFRV